MDYFVFRPLDAIVVMAMEYIPKVILAIITLWVGFWLVNWIVVMMQRTFKTNRVDRSLRGFFESLVGVGLKIMVLMTVAMMLGIQMASFIAVLGAAGLAIGLSLQGSLSNLAGGILILLFKPFDVGEEIGVLAQRGTVERIEIFRTVIRESSGVMIILPNGPLSNGVITNYSRRANVQGPTLPSPPK